MDDRGAFDFGLLWGEGLPGKGGMLAAFACDCGAHAQHVHELMAWVDLLRAGREVRYWKPTERCNLPVEFGGRWWVERTRYGGLPEGRAGLIVTTPFAAPHAEVELHYSATVKIGDLTDIVGGVAFEKVTCGARLPCHPAEVEEVRARLAEYLGGVVRAERDEILREHGLDLPPRARPGLVGDLDESRGAEERRQG